MNDEVARPPPPIVAGMGAMALLEGFRSILKQVAGDGLLTEPKIGSAAPPVAVIKAILGVMSRVRQVDKTGTNKKDKYRYVEWAVLSAHLQDALVQEGLVIAQREVHRAIANKILFIRYQFDCYHESGAWIMNMASGTGACRVQYISGSTDDKAANKALTAGAKAVLTSLFKIPADVADIERDDIEPGAGNRRQDGPPGNGERRDEDRRPLSDDRRGGEDRRPPSDDRGPGWDDRGPPPGWDDRGPPEWDDRGAPDDRRPPDNPEAPPFDGPPADDRPPYAGPGNSAPPPADPAEVDFRRNVDALSEALKHATALEDAQRIWSQNADLIRQMVDSTFEHFRTRYFARWNEAPPRT